MEKNNLVNGRGNKDTFLVVATILLMLSLITITIQPKITGLVVFEQSRVFNIGQAYSADSSEPLNINSQITSLRITGNFTGDGSAKVWIESSGKRYLILDTDNLSSTDTSNGITGMVVDDTLINSDNSTQDNTVISTTDTNTPENTIVNATENTADGAIDTALNISETNSDNNVTENLTENITENIALNTTENSTGTNSSINVTENTTSNETTQENISVSNETVVENITINETAQENISLPNESMNVSNNVSENITSTNISMNVTSNVSIISKTFDYYCDGTCALSNITAPYTLIVQVSGNSTIYIGDLSYKYMPEATIVQTKNIPDIILSDNLTIDLAQYFSGENILYDSVHLTYVNYSVSGSKIAYKALKPGTENAMIYATVAGELVTSNTFTITVMPSNLSENLSNKTMNQTMNLSEIVVDDNFTKINLLKKLKNIKIGKLLKRIKADNTSDYDVEFDDANDSSVFVKIYGIKNITMLSRVNIIAMKNHKQANIDTDIVDVNTLNITNATIRLHKYGDVSAIAMCEDYDSTNNTCDSWVTTDIPFIDYGDYIEFTVDHFTGYGGIVGSTKLYVTGTTSYDDVVASTSLSASQDGTWNYMNSTNNTLTGPGIVLNVLNASYNVTSGFKIRTTDQVNFSTYWNDAAAINFVYATFKLYYQRSGNLNLICKNGSDTNSSGEVQIPDNAVGLRVGACYPSSDVIINSGDKLFYVVNIYIQNLGGTAANRRARLLWDNSTYDTWTSYVYIVDTDINVTANQSMYLRGQNVNASGIFYWINGTGVSSKNVTVQFINTTNNVVYTINITTDASGKYAANYTIPSSADLGTWDINVTGFYNGTINATNTTAFTVSLPNPVMNSSRINPVSPNISSTLVGYCNATNPAGKNVSYSYTWYLNNVVNVTGNTSNFTQSIEINVANISSSQLAAGQNWTLGCFATDWSYNSSWMNSSTVTIQNTINITVCTALNQSGWIYAMTNNVSINGSTCFNIYADNVVLDCAGHSIIGNYTTNTYGVYSNSSNTTVKNCALNGFYYQVYYDGSLGTVYNNTVSINQVSVFPNARGIYLRIGSGNNVTGNTIYIKNSASYGMFASLSSNNFIVGNTIFANFANSSDSNSIFLYFNSNDTVSNNVLNTTLGNGISFQGNDSSHFNHTIFNNTDKGLPIVYYKDNSSIIINNLSVANLIVANSNNVTITGNASILTDGIDLYNTYNSTIKDLAMNISRKYLIPLHLYLSSMNNITNNTVLSSSNSSIILEIDYGANNSIIGNYFSNTGDISRDLFTTNSNDNDIINNTFLISSGISGNSYGLNIASGNGNSILSNRISTYVYSYGVYLSSSNNNNVSGNNISANSENPYCGIDVYISDNNLISENNISINSGRECGISMTHTSTNNSIFSNILSTNNASNVGIYTDNLTLGNNTIYYNNFTGTGLWINNSDSSNMFNISVNGIAQGNYYANITSYNITDTDGDGWGDMGSQYPMNSSNSAGKWVGYGADYGPATTRTQSNNPPSITSVASLGSINPIESSSQILKFNFTVNDLDGNSTINISTAKAIVNISGLSRTSSACSGISINATAQNISCNVTINYYDSPGVWSVNVSIKDTPGAYAENTATNFTYSTLTAISINANSFDFGTVSIGQQNATLATPINISNTGNANFTVASIKAYNLVNGSNTIGVGNLTINSTNSSNGNVLINNTFVNITLSSLARSNDTFNASLPLYVYINVPNTPLPAVKYSPITDWILNMLP